ncbi:MAG: Lrp/AsnC family transcriptional regulator [Candidatus Bathyarchaeia archaeon]|jgi:DNA-binding Lrp family transcriptional regulator
MGKRETELSIVRELVKGARRSDREIAKVVGVSQPTVSRFVKKLEGQGLIREYTIIPKLSKMGYELLVFTFLSFAEDRPELFEKAREWTSKQPCVIFAGNGEGCGSNSIMVSIHEDYTSYTNLITQLKRDWQPNLTGEQSFVISLNRSDQMIKQFSFKYLMENRAPRPMASVSPGT